MAWILSDIVSLTQYVMIFGKKEFSDNERCSHCGKSGLWRHGHYARKADRTSKPGESLNPILIQRYCCSSCRRTCSVLPECLPPHRWYLWEIQQITLVLLLAGNSLRAVAREVAPSRRTIARWLARFHEQFRLHKDALCNHLTALSRTTGFSNFWASCFEEMLLSKAMRLCNVAGVSVP